MATKRKANTKKDLSDKIAKLEAKLEKLSAKLETKPAEPKPAQAKPTLPKSSPAKPAESKPAETAKQVPATFNEALESAYYTAPMTDFHKYRTSVTGYSPSPNRYYERHYAIVGKVPTTNWNDQKASVTGYTQPSNQYFATRQRLAFHPADKNFDTFSGVRMDIEGVLVQEKKQQPPKEAPKPQDTPPSTKAQPKSKASELENYEKDYLQRLDQDKIDQQKAYDEALKKEAAEAATRAQTSAGSARGSLPKGFGQKTEPEKPKSSKGTLPKGF